MKLYRGVRATFLNHYSYYALRLKLREIVMLDLYGDGILFVFQHRIMGFKKLMSNKRMSFDFTSVADKCFTFCQSNKLRIIVVGGKELENKSAVEVFKKRYSYINILGINGYIDNLHEILISDGFNRRNDFLILGLGSPKQEDLLLKLKEENYYGIITCGGFISQTANSNGLYYPVLIDRLNLRWFYRLLRTDYVARRLLLIYPKSAIRFAFKGFN